MKGLVPLVIVLFLAACDNDKVPPRPLPAKPTVEAPAPAAARQASVPPVPAQTPGEARQPENEGSEPEKIEPEKIVVEVEPEPAGKADKLPSQRVAAQAPKPAVSAAAPAKKIPVEHVELPDPKLDLSLPEDWAEELQPEQTAQNEQLLPPLFGSDEHTGVQMSGSLLPGENEGEALIDGAQINFEIKR